MKQTDRNMKLTVALLSAVLGASAWILVNAYNLENRRQREVAIVEEVGQLDTVKDNASGSRGDRDNPAPEPAPTSSTEKQVLERQGLRVAWHWLATPPPGVDNPTIDVVGPEGDSLEAQLNGQALTIYGIRSVGIHTVRATEHVSLVDENIDITKDPTDGSFECESELYALPLVDVTLKLSRDSTYNGASVGIEFVPKSSAFMSKAGQLGPELRLATLKAGKPSRFEVGRGESVSVLLPRITGVFRIPKDENTVRTTYIENQRELWDRPPDPDEVITLRLDQRALVTVDVVEQHTSQWGGMLDLLRSSYVDTMERSVRKGHRVKPRRGWRTIVRLQLDVFRNEDAKRVATAEVLAEDCDDARLRSGSVASASFGVPIDASRSFPVFMILTIRLGSIERVIGHIGSNISTAGSNRVEMTLAILHRCIPVLVSGSDGEHLEGIEVSVSLVKDWAPVRSVSRSLVLDQLGARESDASGVVEISLFAVPPGCALHLRSGIDSRSVSAREANAISVSKLEFVLSQSTAKNRKLAFLLSLASEQKNSSKQLMGKYYLVPDRTNETGSVTSGNVTFTNSEVTIETRETASGKYHIVLVGNFGCAYEAVTWGEVQEVPSVDLPTSSSLDLTISDSSAHKEYIVVPDVVPDWLAWGLMNRYKGAERTAFPFHAAVAGHPSSIPVSSETGSPHVLGFWHNGIKYEAASTTNGSSHSIELARVHFHVTTLSFPKLEIDDDERAVLVVTPVYHSSKNQDVAIAAFGVQVPLTRDQVEFEIELPSGYYWSAVVAKRKGEQSRIVASPEDQNVVQVPTESKTVEFVAR